MKRPDWLARAVVALILMSGLAGCSYEPLYGSRAGGPDVEQELSAIRIDEEPTRLGQLVRNELISTMGATGSTYRLKLAVSDSASTVVTYPSPRTSRKSENVVTKYTLYGDDVRRPLTEGQVRSSVSFDLTRSQQPIADRQAESDAEQRAAVEIATEIRTRLSVYFSRRS
jgi:LPS-assembly lipoprotein